jgi:hypothetical protein
MIYGQLQYYSDELNQWLRIVIFQKEALEESRRQVEVILNFPLISLPNLKVANALLDRLATQVQRTKSLMAKIVAQTRQLRNAIADHNVEAFDLEQQKNLRTKMRKLEMRFVKTTCDGSFFISEFFEVAPVPVQPGNAIDAAI